MSNKDFTMTPAEAQFARDRQMAFDAAAGDAFKEAVQASLQQAQLDIQTKRAMILDYTDKDLQELTVVQVQMSIDEIDRNPDKFVKPE